MQRALSLKPMKQAAVRRSSSIRKIQQTNVSGVLLSNSAALTEVCHDLKTPIQTIRGALQLLSLSLDSGQSNSSSARYIDMLDGSSRHLMRMVSNLVDQLRLEAGILAPYPICFDLAEHLNLLVSLSSQYAAFAGIALELEGCDRELFALLDVEKLDKILLNLISNALKYALDDGRVCVRLTCSGRRLTISVQDDGPGIEPERMDHLFHSPADLEPDVFGGARMGLILSRELAELQGGHLTIKNLPEGGVRAQVSLPYIPGDGVPSGMMPSESELISLLRTELSAVITRLR